jgi:hypothetical protein
MHRSSINISQDDALIYATLDSDIGSDILSWIERAGYENVNDAEPDRANYRRSRHQRDTTDGYAFNSNRREDCVQMLAPDQPPNHRSDC